MIQGGSCKTLQLNHHTGSGAAKPKRPGVIAAELLRLSAGAAVADSVSVRTAWKKMSGECPATASHGNARIAVDRTDSGISRQGSVFRRKAAIFSMMLQSPECDSQIMQPAGVRKKTRNPHLFFRFSPENPL